MHIDDPRRDPTPDFDAGTFSYASHTGCFTTITGRDLASVGTGLYYDLACNATNAVLTVKRAEISISDVTVT